MSMQSVISKIAGLGTLALIYYIYCSFNPGTDGIVFGSVCILVGLILGVDVDRVLDVVRRRSNK